MSGSNPITGNVSIEVVFRRKFKVATRRYGDIDNLMKGVMDALNGIVFVDDAQVIKLTARKIQSEKVGMEICID